MLVRDIHIEVANHHDASITTNAFHAPAELSGFHVALHYVDPVLLIERNSGNFVEADNIVLAYKTALPIAVVHKHLGHGRFSA